jgi:predicted nucleic acid binding AN1-type Zn finger protein
MSVDLDNYKCMNEHVKDKKPKCLMCNAKLTLIDQSRKCRCDNLFCCKHIFPENHNCDFDYKNHGRKILSENNPCIKIDKVKGI